MFGSSSIQSFSFFLFLDISFVHIFSLFPGPLVTMGLFYFLVVVYVHLLILVLENEQKKPERAIRAWARMKDKNLKPDISIYALLFSLFGNVNAPYDRPTIQSQAEVTKRINVIEMDMTKNGIHHNLHSLRNLLRALGREKMIKDLVNYVRTAEEKCKYISTNLGIKIYNEFLHSLVKARECQMAFEIFKKMVSSGPSPNIFSLVS